MRIHSKGPLSARPVDQRCGIQLDFAPAANDWKIPHSRRLGKVWVHPFSDSSAQTRDRYY